MNKGSQNNRIILLYKKYLSESISRTEFDELFDLLQDEQNQRCIAELIDEGVPRYFEVIGEVKTDVKDKEQKSIINLFPHHAPNKKLSFRLVVAASVLLLIVSSLFYFLRPSESQIIYATGNHETLSVELPDGSLVVLNANSELKFSKVMKNAEQRVVEFSGEGYFDVAHDAERLFTVRTGSVDVDVLGTEFNLETRREFTNVYLKRGKVVLHSDLIQPIEMLPGDLVKVNNQSKEIDKSSNLEASIDSWKEGVFTFTDLTAIEILQKMEDIYGKEFVIKDSSDLDDIIVVQGLPYIDWDFTREALELALGVTLVDSTSNLIIVKK